MDIGIQIVSVMIVENQKVVSATYELYIADENGKEQLMEKATEEAPLTWCQGEGMMLPAFEAQMAGKTVESMFFNGDGEFDEERVYVGAIVPMNTVDGQIVRAQVCEITDVHVTIDLNHPYAGEDLHFHVQILAIRDVTEGELKAIRNPHHCGKCHGDCGDCDSDCGGNHCGQDACGNCEK